MNDVQQAEETQEATKVNTKAVAIVCAAAIIIVAMALGYSLDQVIALAKILAACLGIII